MLLKNLCRFVLPASSAQFKTVLDDDSAERATNHLTGSTRDTDKADDDTEENGKDGSSGKRMTATQRRKEEKKKRSGANKGRRFGKMRDELELCWKVAIGKDCEYGDS